MVTVVGVTGWGGHDTTRWLSDSRNAGGGNSDMVRASAHQRPSQRLYGHGRQPEEAVTRPKGNTVPLT
jgi:hypothetical protein